ncbi:MAG TPA: hypothetical protein VEB21_17630 [Terriglobales bacterium]|nr:hypothetical protein [Terriglobales bacterium]
MAKPNMVDLSEIDHRETFEIVYDGPALERHEMDVRELAPALLAISDLCQEANRVLNGQAAELAVHVQSDFKPGCFSVSLAVQTIAEQGRDLLLHSENVRAARELLEILGLVAGSTVAAGHGLFRFVQWLRGRRVTAVNAMPNNTSVVTVGGDTFVVHNGVLNVYNSAAARDAMYGALKPLEREGIHEFKSKNRHETVVEITKEEVPYFATDQVEESLGEKEEVGPFQIIKPSFETRYKWMLSDGNGTFGAYIRDERFLDQLERRQVTFAKGDVLRVRYRKATWRTATGLRTEYDTLEVIELIPAPRQIPLFGTSETLQDQLSSPKPNVRISRPVTRRRFKPIEDDDDSLPE